MHELHQSSYLFRVNDVDDVDTLRNSEEIDSNGFAFLLYVSVEASLNFLGNDNKDLVVLGHILALVLLFALG